jgi:micrococcal nuclease
VRTDAASTPWGCAWLKSASANAETGLSSRARRRRRQLCRSSFRQRRVRVVRCRTLGETATSSISATNGANVAVKATDRLSVTATWAVALVVTALVTGIQLAVSGPAEASGTAARVVHWVDGDTVETTQGTVRLIGIDTPERGRCGYRAATRHAQNIAPTGSRVSVGNPASVIDRDKYGRKLRYIATLSGRDLGMAQIRDGARARYDSRDGYQWHRREAAYHRADTRHPNYGCVDGTSPGGTASVAPIDGDCPASAPIKGNANSMIYHRPGQQYYDITVAEECFATAAQAEAAGYRAAQV